MDNKKKEFVCSICGKKGFKHNMALKAHERWHKPKYRENISEKIKVLRQDPNSKYNLPEYKEKIKTKWRDLGYRENISEKIKAVWQDPNSKYHKKKIKGKSLENNANKNFIDIIPKEEIKPIKSIKPKEEIKSINPQIIEYFKKYLIIHNYFDQKSIVKDYIRKEFNGNRIQPNIRVNIEQSFDSLIKNNLEIGKLENYTPTIYRKKR